ncbi:MAG: type VI secretion system tip protein VgrG, partial [Candidatus Eisenbacteria bacterium]|nr:type VI secretion system tip protein VgrG [Candidatus Eisenbacteria bacterium]
MPTKDNLVEAEDPKEHTHAEFQMFDYPGVFVEAYDAEADGEKGDTYAGARGERFARYRMEEMSSKFERVSGDSNMRLLTLGGMFTMADFHRQDQNREHTIVKISYQMSLGGYEAEDSSTGEVDYSCSFEAIPSAGVFRTERTTPAPYIRGPQTAIVVGKEEKEIWTDMHGRVKVKFPWDRKDTTDETSSCWVRVAQVWAGQGWGALHVPRVGQEVIVEFIDGNPNRPIITGRVYNGDNMSPYSLPGSATQSGIKSRSTEEGTDENFNEIRFEDLKDSEEMYIHAEKDQNTVVENDQSTDVGNDQTIHVVKNRNENIDGSRTLVVGEEKEETIEGGKTINVTGGHEETIKGAMAVDVGESRNLVVGASSVEEITDDLT